LKWREENTISRNYYGLNLSLFSLLPLGPAAGTEFQVQSNLNDDIDDQFTETAA